MTDKDASQEPFQTELPLSLGIGDGTPHVPLPSSSFLQHALHFGDSHPLIDSRSIELDKEINDLRSNYNTARRQLKEERENNEQTISQLNTVIKQLQSKEQLRHLLDRVGQDAREKLLSDDDMVDIFNKNKVCNAYVMSIDLRRSTELMLKARKPELFANFITQLATALREIVVSSYGVFDKFTGDGVLAYFPEFFSGKSAGLLAVETALQCHEVFNREYRNSRNCFISVLNEVGLGIGIDYGQISIEEMKNELTVVGHPVVYACRLGGADAGQTLVNQPAYEELLFQHGDALNFTETSIRFKHEGEMLAYLVTRNEKSVTPEKPSWLESEKARDPFDF